MVESWALDGSQSPHSNSEPPEPVSAGLADGARTPPHPYRPGYRMVMDVNEVA